MLTLKVTSKINIIVFTANRVFKYNFLLNANVSKRLGCLKDSATDIHYLEDLNKAKNKMKL